MSWLDFKDQDSLVIDPLYVDIRGKGTETLVFIAGLGGTTRYWESRLQSIEGRYRIVLVDLLGFGRSPKPWMQYTVERQVAALHDAIQSFAPFTLVGHSLGALIAVAYAAEHPEKVKNIVPIGMPYFGSEAAAYRYMRGGSVQGGFVYTSVALTMITCILTRRLFGWLLPYIIRSVPREVAEDLVKHTWRSSTSSLWDVVYRYDIRSDLERLPTRIRPLFIHGDEDIMAPVGAIEGLVRDHPAWRVEVRPGIDHHPFLRDPAGCLALIESLQTSELS